MLFLMVVSVSLYLLCLLRHTVKRTGVSLFLGLLLLIPPWLLLMLSKWTFSISLCGRKIDLA
jgi:hypothetical protein